MLNASRDYYPGAPRTDGVIRVWCIGDSLMHGAAVPPGQSFPAHLERQLNAAGNGLYETVNRGMEGANAWNSWLNVRALFRPGICDAMVFGLCGNDARILEWAGLVAYDPLQDAALWRPDGVGGRALARLLDELDQFVADTGLPVLVFHHHYPAVAAPQDLAALFEGRRVRFVDAAHQLADTLASMPAGERVASPVDGHPSGRMHEVFARHIARILARTEGMDRPVAADPVEVPNRVIAAVDATAKAGGAVERALAWGQVVLDAKEAALRRAVPLDRVAEVEAALSEAKAELAARTSFWSRALRLELNLRAARDEFMLGFDANAAGFALIAAEECLYWAATAPEEAARLMAPRPARGLWGRQHVLEGLAGRIDRLAALGGQPPEGGVGEVVACRLAGVWSSVRGQLEALSGLAARAVALGAQLERVPASAVAGEAMERLDTVCDALARIVDRLAPLTEGTDACYADFVTVVEIGVDVEDPATTITPGMELSVFARYTLPQRMPVRQFQHLGVNLRRHVYRFELPLMAAGDLVLVLENRGGDPELPRRHGIVIRSVVAYNRKYGGEGETRAEQRLDCELRDFTVGRVGPLAL